MRTGPDTQRAQAHNHTIMIPGRVVRSTREKTQGEPLPVLHYMYFYRWAVFIVHTLTFSKLSHHVLCEECEVCTVDGSSV